MPTPIRAAGAVCRAHPESPLQSPEPPLQSREPGGDLLEKIGDVEHEHILLLGHNEIDLMCALLRAGALEVSHLSSPELAEPESASLVIVPRLPSQDWLASALRSIGRALLPTGRLILCVATHGDMIMASRIRRTLARHGYSKIRSSVMHTNHGETCLLTTADCPRLVCERWRKEAKMHKLVSDLGGMPAEEHARDYRFATAG